MILHYFNNPCQSQKGFGHMITSPKGVRKIKSKSARKNSRSHFTRKRYGGYKSEICKGLLRETLRAVLVRSAPSSDGTSIEPEEWVDPLEIAIAEGGALTEEPVIEVKRKKKTDGRQKGTPNKKK